MSGRRGCSRCSAIGASRHQQHWMSGCELFEAWRLPASSVAPCGRRRSGCEVAAPLPGPAFLPLAASVERVLAALALGQARIRSHQTRISTTRSLDAGAPARTRPGNAEAANAAIDSAIAPNTGAGRPFTADDCVRELSIRLSRSFGRRRSARISRSPRSAKDGDSPRRVRIAHHIVTPDVPDEQATVGETNLEVGRKAFGRRHRPSVLALQVLDERERRIEQRRAVLSRGHQLVHERSSRPPHSKGPGGPNELIERI